MLIKKASCARVAPFWLLVRMGGFGRPMMPSRIPWPSATTALALDHQGATHTSPVRSCCDHAAAADDDDGDERCYVYVPPCTLRTTVVFGSNV